MRGWEGWLEGEESVVDLDLPVLVDAYSSRGLEASTGGSKTEVNASLKRSYNIGMAKIDRKSKLPKANIS